LREDLPVTIASFDNHFSVDAMFAIGRTRGVSVAGLFAGAAAGELAQLGEYGVQFLASERRLEPPDDDLLHLSRVLAHADLPGILVLDTRPVLDYFTRCALAAADLVIVPVKDRPSLTNASSVRAALCEAGGEGARMWLLPSLIDARLKLREGIGLHEFLTFSARERGHQVLDIAIAKSPKVEGLATGFSRRVHPVLTHGRGTAVHRQLRALADFVLKQFEAAPTPVNRQRHLERAAAMLPAGRRLRMLPECPLCAQRSPGGEVRFFESLPSRRRGYLHQRCLTRVFGQTGLAQFDSGTNPLLFVIGEVGLAEEHSSLGIHLLSAGGELIENAYLPFSSAEAFAPFLRSATGRLPQELHRHAIVAGPVEAVPGQTLDPDGYRKFAELRKRALRTMLERIGSAPPPDRAIDAER